MTVPKASTSLRWLGLALWYGAGLLLLLAYVRGALLPAVEVAKAGSWRRGADLVLLGQAALGLVLLALLFAAIHVGVRAMLGALDRAPGPPPAGSSFPGGVTVAVGAWVLAYALLSLGALVASFLWSRAGPVRGALATTSAAGVGSAIATVLGYLKHASEQKDFDPAYSAWYVGRPVIGLLLGLLFYFLMEGGLLIVVRNSQAGDLNEYALAGLGGMVGLFSKNAVEKLRELFNVLFATKDQANQELLASLPADLREQVLAHQKTQPR